MKRRFNLRRASLLQNRKLLAYERAFAKLIYKALQEQLEYALKNNFEINDNLKDVLEKLYLNVGIEFVNEQVKNLEGMQTDKESRFFLNSWKTWISEFANTTLVSKVAQINQTTRDILRQVVTFGFGRGLEFEVLAEMVREKAGHAFGMARAMTIARTEVASAANEAKERSSQDWEGETGENLYKIWIHRGAKNPRDWHVKLDNNKAIPQNQEFAVLDDKTGDVEYMMRPHSANASAKNVINCGCQVIYVSESYANRLNSTN